MKFSAWSSRSISVFSALLLAPSAAAHVTVSPTRVDPGAEAQLRFSVPNERDAGTVTRVAIGLPPGFTVGEVGVKSGWQVEPSGSSVSWTGGRLGPHEFADFALHVNAPPRSERGRFNVLESFEGGQTVTYAVTITVAHAPGVHDPGARTLSKAALIVATLAALVALSAGFLALWVWLRPPPL